MIKENYDEVYFEENTVDLSKLLEALLKKHPALGNWLDSIPVIQIYINGREVLDRDKIILRDNDEVVISPPLYEGG